MPALWELPLSAPHPIEPRGLYSSTGVLNWSPGMGEATRVFGSFRALRRI